MEFKQLVSDVMLTTFGAVVNGTLNVSITLNNGTHKLVAFMSNYRALGTVTEYDITVNGHELITDIDPKDGRGTMQKSMEITVDSETTLTFTFKFASTYSSSHQENVVCFVSDYM